MTSPIDIMRCAKLLCEQYGTEADLIAAIRADRLLEQGELDGYATWKAILKAIVDIRTVSPRPDQNIH
jgi:hypothetical protein